VGPGGFAGFNGSAVKEVRYHKGGHGAMLVPANLESMLGFILDGKAPEQNPALISEARWMGRLSRAALLLAPLIMAGTVVGIVYGTLTWGWAFFVVAAVVLALFIFVLEIF
jgi:hypothetical protein